MFEELFLATAGRHGAVAQPQNAQPFTFDPWVTQANRPTLSPSLTVSATKRADAACSGIQQRGANATLDEWSDAVKRVSFANTAKVDLDTRFGKANCPRTVIEDQIVAADKRSCPLYFFTFRKATFSPEKTPAASQGAGSYVEGAFRFASQLFA